MKSLGPHQHFVFAFLIALAVYVVLYNGCEHQRTHNGPWQVTFTNENAVPELVIDEPKLQIANLRISFPQESAAPAAVTMRFDNPRPWPFDVPFGQCIFEDTTFLPGTIVFKVFGHEIQLLPRTLTIDKVEYPWQSNTNIVVRK